MAAVGARRGRSGREEDQGEKGGCKLLGN